MYCKIHDAIYFDSEWCDDCFEEAHQMVMKDRCKICSDKLPPTKVCESCGRDNSNL